jgi:hypothetical protein
MSHGEKPLAGYDQAIELSGIVTILFTGMFSRHYTHGNLSVDGQVRRGEGLRFEVCVDDRARLLKLTLRFFRAGRASYLRSSRL